MIVIFKNLLAYPMLVVKYWINFFIMAWWAIFSETQGYFGSIFIIMTVAGLISL